MRIGKRWQTRAIFDRSGHVAQAAALQQRLVARDEI